MKFIKGFFLIVVLFFLYTVPAYADGEFITDVDVEYKVLESGKTAVTNKITLENVFSTLYATKYSLVLESIKPQNPKAYDGLGELILTKSEDGNAVTLQVEFKDAAVGKGKQRTFWVSFEEDSFAVRTGEVWEISIPRLSSEESFRSYNVSLAVPQSIGKEAYISPKPRSYNDYNNYKYYKFYKEDVAKTGITAGFGEFQVFNFNLNYHLENPLAKQAVTEIAIPPDTAFQKIYFQSIIPKPVNISLDQDGNWLASYKLKPRERINVEIKGSVQIFASHRQFPKPSPDALNENLKQTQYWQIDDPTIQELAKNLKTPKAIYDYVWQNLKYDYDRVKPNIERLGAKEALASPKSAICMEFTDLFIALARAAGIPAREINGFAYTENPKIQPLSLVSDVLHSWPEYWDKDRQVWIPVDPTWASTTKGVDFFSKLDLRHFTFVIHGLDPLKPYAAGSYKLGSNPQKDVYVGFGQLPETTVPQVRIVAKIERVIPFTPTLLNINLENPKGMAIYNLNPEVYFDGKLTDSIIIESLPPYSDYHYQIKIPFSFLGSKTPSKVTISALDQTQDVLSPKSQVIIYNLLTIFAVITVVTLLIFKYLTPDA